MELPSLGNLAWEKAALIATYPRSESQTTLPAYGTDNTEGKMEKGKVKRKKKCQKIAVKINGD